MEHKIVLIYGPYDGGSFDLEYPPPTALVYRGERYIWAGYADPVGRPTYIHHPEVPLEDCRVIEP